MFRFVALVMLASALNHLTSCEKESKQPLSWNSEVVGAWRFNSMFVENVDKTTIYADKVLVFNSGGTAELLHNNGQVKNEGTWNSCITETYDSEDPQEPETYTIEANINEPNSGGVFSFRIDHAVVDVDRIHTTLLSSGYMHCELLRVE